MELICGTGNQAKLTFMREALAGLDIQIIGLIELGQPVPSVPETGASPLDNARIKALAYFRAFGKPVFSCDSGLYFDGLADELQPGVHVRTVNGRTLTDEEMIAYYGGMAKQHGDLKARYKNAICLVLDEAHIFESMADDLSGNTFLLTSLPHSKRVQGFPLDSISVHIPTGQHYYDLMEQPADDIVQRAGFRRFFETVLSEIGA